MISHKLTRRLSLLAGLVAAFAFSGEAQADELSGSVAPQTIIGGTQTDGYEGVVALVVGDKICTGTLVSPRVVLTAAHCVEHADGIEVHFGPRESSGGGIRAERWGAHPDYCDTCSTERTDFGFVQLPRPVDVAPVIPAATPEEIDASLRLGREVLLVGYGASAPTGSTGSMGDKRVVVTEISDFTAHGLEFLAGGGGRDTCDGDSGGPALVRLPGGELRLLGVTSRGTTPCGSGGYYGLVYPALCWLDGETGVDLRRDGCGSCDCIALPSGESTSCSVAKPRRGSEVVAWLLVVLGLCSRRKSERESRD